MDKLLQQLKNKLTHKHTELEKERLDVFQFPIFQTGEQIDFALLEAGTNHPPHVHEEGSARLYIICGKGKIILENKTTSYEEGQVYSVPKGTTHGFEVEESTVLLSVQDKPILHDGKLDFRYDERSGI